MPTMVCQLLCYTAIISMRDIIPDERLEREVRQFILHDLALSARSRSVTGYESGLGSYITSICIRHPMLWFG